MSKYTELPKNKILTNMIGKMIPATDLVAICERLNEMIRGQGNSEITITPQFFVSAYENSAYFLKVLSFLIDSTEEGEEFCFKYFLEDYNDLKNLELSDKDSLDLRINENQYKQCDIMTKKRVNTTYPNKSVRKLLSSDLDLFVSSFDQTIDDTFSRNFFLEEVVKL